MNCAYTSSHNFILSRVNEAVLAKWCDTLKLGGVWVVMLLMLVLIVEQKYRLWCLVGGGRSSGSTCSVSTNQLEEPSPLDCFWIS